VTKKKKTTGLSTLGDSAERVLTEVLKDMEADMKLERKDRIYTLTDHMKVMDRVAKFEAIRAQLKNPDEGEGSFFRNSKEADGEPE
jgi:hypothetical protein